MTNLETMELADYYTYDEPNTILRVVQSSSTLKSLLLVRRICNTESMIQA
jgi:hypothetical protein